MIEKNKAEILSLYALLSMNEITGVYVACENYMNVLNQGSIAGLIEEKKQQDDNAYIGDPDGETPQNHQISTQKTDHKTTADADDEDSELKVKYRSKRTRNRRGTRGTMYNMSNLAQSNIQSNEIYAEMVKRTFSQMRDLSNKEDDNRDERMKQQ